MSLETKVPQLIWQDLKKNEWVIHVLTAPDQNGHQTFCIQWRTDYIVGSGYSSKWRLVRSQMFSAPLEATLKRAKDQKKKIRITYLTEEAPTMKKETKEKANLNDGTPSVRELTPGMSLADRNNAKAKAYVQSYESYLRQFEPAGRHDRPLSYVQWSRRYKSLLIDVERIKDESQKQSKTRSPKRGTVAKPEFASKTAQTNYCRNVRLLKNLGFVKRSDCSYVFEKMDYSFYDYDLRERTQKELFERCMSFAWHSGFRQMAHLHREPEVYADTFSPMKAKK